MSLMDDLRDLGTEALPFDTDGDWMESLRPQLPREPLSSRFITEAIEPLTVRGQARVLEMLRDSDAPKWRTTPIDSSPKVMAASV